MDYNFDGLTPEQKIAKIKSILGVRSPREIAEAKKEEWERYEREQAQYAEWYDSGVRWVEIGYFDKRVKRLFKRTCPSCGTVFYTTNERRKYDDYYKCSRYVHRENARERRRDARKTICLQCGQEFTPDRTGAKYCSGACKQKAYRERKAKRPK